MTQLVKGIDASSDTFKRDLKRLPPELLTQARERMKLLLDDPAPSKLRAHLLKSHSIWKIDLQSGKGARYQASFKIVEGIAVFLRAGPHKLMDRLYK